MVALQGRGDYRRNMIYATTYYLCSTFPAAILTIFTDNLYIIFAILFISQAIFRFIAYHTVKKKLNINMKNLDAHNLAKSDIKEFRKESLAISFTGALASAQVNASSAIVFNRLGPSEVAIYSIALTFADFVSGMIGATMSKIQLVLSRISKQLGYTRESNQEKIKIIRGMFKKYF